MKYSFSLITYLDVLGFRDLIRNKTSREISTIVRILKEKTKPDREIAKIHGIKFINFSDTTVRITPLDTPWNVNGRFGYAYFEILGLVHIQCGLIHEGIIIRGALTVGEIVKNQGVIYGQVWYPLTT